ncbi:hypothetical protein Pjdr2_0421 [Paenibacillus sp. JDR-2]|nr:hypothetical protein Pjdr2_0421 [Paenibacillus sp. JDR-2]
MKVSVVKLIQYPKYSIYNMKLHDYYSGVLELPFT